ncbi:orexigenic neuropeptide QRFP [Pantherophis guttatus]|uniref:Orexigenic neuropeptide QRFP n=1 Tax=Pantherophis guttatus TaxID=94885 RepID=A0A6P9DI97_PANGU|nr:orexigenic neuropeptide QRFP [Pantherophis guttatus]
MKFPNHLSCLLLLSFGTSLPAADLQAPKHPGEEFQGLPNEPGFGEDGGVKWRRSPVDLNPLFSIAKELQSFGKEKAGIQFRFGRQDTDENLNAVTDLLKEDGEKEAKNLGTLTERRNGYYDGKIWFGRRKREVLRAKGSFPGAPKLTGSI